MISQFQSNRDLILDSTELLPFLLDHFPTIEPPLMPRGLRFFFCYNSRQQPAQKLLRTCPNPALLHPSPHSHHECSHTCQSSHVFYFYFYFLLVVTFFSVPMMTACAWSIVFQVSTNPHRSPSGLYRAWFGAVRTCTGAIWVVGVCKVYSFINIQTGMLVKYREFSLQEIQ